MEVSKLPQADLSTARAGAAAGSSAGSTAAQTSTSTDTESSPAATIVSATDFADIRPLDLVAALQILIAEVRAQLDASLEGPIMLGAAPSIAQNPVQAAKELVEMLLRALPEDASDAPAWTDALIRVETAVQSSLERAVSVVAAWRDTPPPVVDAAKQTQAMFLEALGDEVQNPLWLRPEWMGSSAPILRLRRRRRNARRRLTDPDYSPANLDESEEFPR
jgi:hypothetical protein